MNGRRPFVRLYKALYDECRADLAALDLKHQRALAAPHAELDRCRADLEQLRNAVRARIAAEAEVERLRAIKNASTAERDPTMRLQ